MSQPYFEKNVKVKLTLPKWELESPPGLPKLQSSILGVKTPCIEAFFISLERYQNVYVENGLTWAIWTYVTQVMAKRKVESQIGTKSWESTQPRCVQVECDTPLESSQWELQVCFRPHPNRRSDEVLAKSYDPAKCRESKPGQFRDSSLGVGIKSHSDASAMERHKK